MIQESCTHLLSIDIFANYYIYRPATDALKTTSKKVIKKTAEATGDLIGNKIANKSK